MYTKKGRRGSSMFIRKNNIPFIFVVKEGGVCLHVLINNAFQVVSLNSLFVILF